MSDDKLLITDERDAERLKEARARVRGAFTAFESVLKAQMESENTMRHVSHELRRVSREVGQIFLLRRADGVNKPVSLEEIMTELAKQLDKQVRS